ncbi:prefoldin subunit alpha [Candidatus Pacearchaeota archaeon]|nr:MAG: prefoldin subunit alpha [Candidatus Pacearchaeota archaeon]
MEKDKKQQELMFKLSMFEQQIQNINQQIQAVENAIVDMTSLEFGLDNIKGKKGEEILASIGKGIFVKAKLLSEDLIVDIGDKNLIKKSIPDTQKIIANQIEKLKEARQELDKAMEEINTQLTQTMTESQGE